LSQAPGVTPP
jgi:xanthosine utilization system XapX-like protein